MFDFYGLCPCGLSVIVGHSVFFIYKESSMKQASAIHMKSALMERSSLRQKKVTKFQSLSLLYFSAYFLVTDYRGFSEGGLTPFATQGVKTVFYREKSNTFLEVKNERKSM